MDRLAAHVIATAALTVTLATVPMLFADTCHASSSAVSRRPSPAEVHVSPERITPPPAVAVLPALPGPAQTQTLAAAPADAGTAPAPAGTARPAAAAGSAEAGLGSGRRARPADRMCADVRQIGRTAHARYRGMIAFSVRQYFSARCHAYFGYAQAWTRFRRLHVPFDVGMAVYATRAGSIEGARTYLGGQGGPVYWSAPVAARAGECTKGEGHFFYYPSGAPGGFIEGDTLTAPACG